MRITEEFNPDRFFVHRGMHHHTRGCGEMIWSSHFVSLFNPFG